MRNMFKVWKELLLTLTLTSAFLMPATALAATTPPATSTPSDAKSQVCEGVGLTSGTTGCDDTSGGPSVDSTIRTVINLLSLAVGIIAVIMVIIGGLKYITSSGDSNNVNSAKNTILYAVVGLVVVVLAQVIVRFVLNRAAPSTTCKTGQTLVNGVCQ